MVAFMKVNYYSSLTHIVDVNRRLCFSRLFLPNPSVVDRWADCYRSEYV